MCSSPICSEEHLVFYHIFSQFFTNIFEFLNLKTENGEKYRNSISRLLAETENFPVFRRFSAGKFFPGTNYAKLQGGELQRKTKEIIVLCIQVGVILTALEEPLGFRIKAN